jgi:hypothetical protein
MCAIGSDNSSAIERRNCGRHFPVRTAGGSPFGNNEMIYVWFIAGLLIVAGLLVRIAGLLKKCRSEISAACERERALAERLAKVEAILAEKASVTESHHLAAMVDGVASISQRLEGRLSALEGRSSQRESTGD